MNYQFIGQIKGAKAVSRKDKTTGTTVSNAEVIIQFEDHDKNGELVLDTNTIQFPIDDLQVLKDNVQKYICVHFVFLQTPKGSYLFPDENMNYEFYEYNPLIPIHNKENKKPN